MSDRDQPVILNVDDNEAGRYAVTRILQHEGFQVLEAGTAAEAIELAQREPDVILLDVNLPDGSGFEVCRRIKSDARTRDIPVLHLSAIHVSDHDRATGLVAGADAYLTHPIEPELLVATIRMLLRTRRAESGARAAAREWQATFDAVSHGVCLLDREGRIVRANRAMAEAVGVPVRSLVGKPYDAAFWTAARPPEGWPFERTRGSRQRETAEIEVESRWFLVTADPLLDEAGEFQGAVRTVVEITDRKRAERERERLLHEIDQQRARLEALIEHLPVGVVLAEAGSGRIVLANEQATRIFGEPIGGAHKGFHSSGGRAYGVEQWPLARSISSGEVVTNEEIDIQRGDGTRAALLVSSAPVRERQGFIVAGVAVFQDVTERKQLGDQLRQSQKMEAVGRMAGGVAHDFNNLLTIIGGYGQMVADSLEPGNPLRRDMESILEAANRASALTKQLLTVSRRQVIQPKVFDLNRLLSRMNRMLRRVIREDVELVTAAKAEQARIKADPGQIEQVLLNLAVNARDAMPTGGRLTLETANIEVAEDTPVPGLGPGRYVLLAVSDTGTGMSPEVMSHLFEPFFTTKPKGKGTGLGLSTAYGIIKQTGGEILAESAPGQGATFRIYFPSMSGVDRAAEAPAQAEVIARRGTETLLLVEDEADVRRLAAEMLMRQGYRVLEAASGFEALRVWEECGNRIDMLITDVVMPKMSGHELAARLRALRPGLRIMYISGYTEDVVARHGIDGQIVLLQKPFTSDALARAVRTILDSAA